MAVLDRTSGEVMHPIVGPRVESAALYIAPSRLVERLSDPSRAEPLVLFDVGLGAGSNAVAAWQAVRALPNPRRPLRVVSFDRGLEAFILARSAAHADSFGYDAELASFASALEEDGNAVSALGEWHLVLGELPDAFDAVFSRGASSCADVVFWDPFSPKANPELWSVAAFTRVRALCASSATLHTYSSATATRAALLLAGFAVGVGPTVGAARPTTIAAVEPDFLQAPLERRWFERLARSSAPFPGDAPADALERIRVLPQFG